MTGPRTRAGGLGIFLAALTVTYLYAIPAVVWLGEQVAA